MRPDRHSFVWLAAGCLENSDRSAIGREDFDVLSTWISEGRPLVVASSREGDALAKVRAGLATPAKQRIGVVVNKTDVVQVRSAPSLDFASSFIPDGWEENVRLVEDVARSCNLDVRVFGSLAWSAMTGIEYLRPGSDLDLILTAKPDADLPRALALLLEIKGDPRLDGELRLTTDEAVSFREFARGSGEMLIKGHNGPRLAPFSDIERFTTEAA